MTVPACLAASLLAILGCGSSGTSGDVPTESPTRTDSHSVASPELDDHERVPQRSPSEAARGQAGTIETLRSGGWAVETNGREEAVVATWESGAVGPEAAQHLAALDTLERVTLWMCPDADDLLLDRLSGLKRLTSLTVRGGRVSDACVESLSRMTALESLNLGDTRGFTGAGLEKLMRSKGLKRVVLDGTGVTDAVVSSWPRESGLEMVNLNRTQIGAGAVASLKKMTTLRSVFVVDVTLPGDVAAAWRRDRPNCLLFDGKQEPSPTRSRPTSR